MAFDPDSVLKHIPFPDLPLVRDRARAMAERDEFTEGQKACPHNVRAVSQMVDVVNTVDRHERPTNLFSCEICGQVLWLIDPYGKEARDG